MQNKKKILPEIYNFLRPKQTKKLARFGINKDGGYVVELTALDRINHLISFGMADEFSFEIDFLNHSKFNTVQIYDYTVNHKKYIYEIFKVFRRIITFRKKIIDLKNALIKYYNFLKFIRNKRVKFYPLKISKEIKSDVDINLNGVFTLINKKINNIGLKIDIEGDEYNLLDSVLDNSNRINFLIIEFHNIGNNKEIFMNFMKKIINKFDIIHIHGNNHENLQNDGFPNVAEISLVNKNNNLEYVNFPTSFPIKGLDYPNNPFVPDIKFDFS